MQKVTLFSLFGATGAALLAAAAFAFSSGPTYAADPAAPPEGTVPQPTAAEHYEVPLGLNTNPVIMSDCVSPALDCCNPSCKLNISGCCETNVCGLPKQTTITGKGPWARETVECSMVGASKE